MRINLNKIGDDVSNMVNMFSMFDTFSMFNMFNMFYCMCSIYSICSILYAQYINLHLHLGESDRIVHTFASVS